MKLAPLSFVPLILAATCVAQSIPTDSAMPTSQSAETLPADPAALLQLAFRVNGLHGSDLQPWHVRATWRTLDEKGNVADEGAWEEWWAGEKKYRIVYAQGGFAQTLFVTDRGAFVTGDPDTPNLNFSLVNNTLKQPMGDQKFISDSKWRLLQRNQGNGVLVCAARKPDSADERYCFTDNLPAVRSYSSPVRSWALNSFVLFQGRYLAQKIQIVRDGQPEVDIKVDRIEPIDVVSDADFAPPAEAVPASAHPVLLDSDIANGKWISGSAPEFSPAYAFPVRASVTVELTIRRDGSVADPQVISGPPMLREPVLRAVKTYRYSPCFLAGQPVDVRTQIQFNFRTER